MLQQYESLLSDMGNIQMPEFKVSREAHFKAEPLVLNPELKNFTNYVSNMTLQPNLFVFQDLTNSTTEFVRIPASGEIIESISSFPVLFNHVTQHQSRLICDNYVYSMRDFQRI